MHTYGCVVVVVEKIGESINFNYGSAYDSAAVAARYCPPPTTLAEILWTNVF